ncbi:MAG: HD domain-containing protein [Planctomycetes bacterium]|nr:HD domain-containing protein [Planctomycetota bacterium]
MTPKSKQVFKRIREMVEGETLVTFLLVESASLRKKADGSDYLALRLKDRTGSIEAKIWDEVNRYRELRAGDIVKVEAEVRSFRGKPDLSIRRLRLLEDRDREEGFDEKWLEEWTEFVIEDLWARLSQFVDRIESPPIRHLVQAVLSAKEETLKRSPAAKQVHHPYFGGLLEHTVWLVDDCIRLLDNYKFLDHDLVIAGAILHDIGKTEELGGERVTDYTVDGRLVGHIVLGRDILRRHAALIPDFPGDALRHLEHLILSHQGEREWGSPVLPSTPEALFVHLVDNLDAKMQMVQQAVRRTPEGQPFSEYHATLGRQFYLVRRSVPEPGRDEQRG